MSSGSNAKTMKHAELGGVDHKSSKVRRQINWVNVKSTLEELNREGVKC